MDHTGKGAVEGWLVCCRTSDPHGWFAWSLGPRAACSGLSAFLSVHGSENQDNRARWFSLPCGVRPMPWLRLPGTDEACSPVRVKRIWQEEAVALILLPKVNTGLLKWEIAQEVFNICFLAYSETALSNRVRLPATYVIYNFIQSTVRKKSTKKLVKLILIIYFIWNIMSTWLWSK